MFRVFLWFLSTQFLITAISYYRGGSCMSNPKTCYLTTFVAFCNRLAKTRRNSARKPVTPPTHLYQSNRRDWSKITEYKVTELQGHRDHKVTERRPPLCLHISAVFLCIASICLRISAVNLPTHAFVYLPRKSMSSAGIR